MRVAALAAAVVAAFVGVMYLRFASDSVPRPPAGAVGGGPQCVVFRTVSNGADGQKQATCGPVTAPPTSASVVTSTSPPALSGPPSFLSGKELIPLKIGPAIEFPENTALIAALGCAPCGAPDQGLVRVYRDSAGSYRVDDLLGEQRFNLPPRLVDTPEGPREGPRQVVGMATNADGSEIFVAFCTRGNCLTVEASSGETESTIFRSKDGGFSWEPLGTLPDVRMLAGVVESGLVLVGSLAEGKPSLEFSLFPGGEIVDPPTSNRVVWPTVLASGEIFWNVEQRSILRADGSSLLDISNDPQTLSIRPYVLGNAEGTNAFGSIDYNGGELTYLLELGSEHPSRALLASGQVLAGIWTEDGLIFGNTSLRPQDLPGRPIPFRGLPAIIDLANHSVTPIAGPFLEEPFAKASVEIVAVKRGPFERVINTNDTCLNVRSEPLPSAGILECAAEGVLLRDLGDATEFAGSTWLHIATPGGAEGWANAQYLER